MNEYTPIVMDHFNNPRNVGIINNHDGMGEIGDPELRGLPQGLHKG